MNIYEEEKEEQVEVPTKKKRNRIPSEYVEVSYSTLGHFDCPDKLHFRDYSMEEIRNLAFAKEEDSLEVLVDCLNSMVYEDFDCADMNQRELLETVYILQGKFYSPFIVKSIYKDPDIEDPDLRNSDDNIVVEEIPLSALEIETIQDEFREPFTLTDDKSGQVAKMRLHRIRDIIDSKEKFVEENFKKEKIYKPVMERYKHFLSKTKNDEEAQRLLYSDFEGQENLVDEAFDYVEEKFKKITEYTEASVLVAYEGKELSSLDEKLEYYKKISARIWSKFNKVLEEYPFGIQEETTFYSAKLDQKITRRLALQVTDFLPDNDEEANKSVTVQFG